MESDDQMDIQKDLDDTFRMLETHTISDAELNTIKGDTIGDTVYSSKWIINTLISVSKVHETGWTEELENDLCMLWDMTAEKDIVKYLAENEILKIAEVTIATSDTPRLTEIVIGILANMSCQADVLKAIGDNDELVKTTLNCLLTDDTETLIQILRLLQACVWDIQKTPESVWLRNLRECEFLGDVLTFVLQSSTNNDLLTATINFIYSILETELNDVNLLTEIFKIDKLLPALVESFKQIMSEPKDIQSDICILENWLAILSNIVKSNLVDFKDYTDEINVKIMSILLEILQPYEYLEDLTLLDERVASCIQECIEIILWFQYNELDISPDINHVIIKLILNLRAGMEKSPRAPEDDSHLDSSDTIRELCKYLETYWVTVIQLLPEEKIQSILHMCDDQITSVIELTKEHPKMSDECLKKLLKVESYIRST